MKSPITGKEMKLIMERRSMEFRKEIIEVIFHFYKCEDSGEQFTNTALDEVNMNQLYNQYREKFKIPFPDEIIRIRGKFGLSAAKMSEILGFGINSYRQYEAGEMPSIANAKLIQMVEDPERFLDMVALCGTLDEKSRNKYLQRAKLLVEEKEKNSFNTHFKEYLLGNHLADVFSGYRNPSFEKFTEMVVFFSEKNEPFKTKLNKLLFYADFLMFKISCFLISGVRYKAIDMGPVPNNFQSIFEFLANKEEIEIITTEFPNGYTGERFKAKKGRSFNPKLFSEVELEVLEKVSTEFQHTTTTEIIAISHLEEAWEKNNKGRAVISYEYAFQLNQIKY